MTEDRSLDVVVYGATGFVGKLLAEYLAAHAPDGARIGLAGRTLSKLEATRAALPAGAREWPLIVADQDDHDSLVAMAKQTQVVATTVGPYRRQGMGLVDACIAGGADYADLTGEVLFVHEAIARHDDAAAAGVRIVHSVGFDSIPSDLGVLLLHEAAQADGAGELEETTLVVKGMRGGVSGGTLGSMLGQIEDLKTTPAVKKIINDPYALDPTRVAEKPGEKERDTAMVERDRDLGLWLAPFVMAAYNTRIVRRSNGLLDGAYGKRFRYREVMSAGSSPAAPVIAAGVAGGLGGFAAGMSFGPTRSLLTKVLPDPGEGPSEKAREKGFFKIEVHTRTSSGARYVSRVSASGDPGYKATALMMGESALCLALDRSSLPDRFGVLTPATAMGDALVERLRAAGMTLEVEKL